MSSAEYSCRLFKPIFAYRQTVWTLKEQSDLGPHCLQKWLLKSQADDKADDNSCDWRICCPANYIAAIWTGVDPGWFLRGGGGAQFDKITVLITLFGQILAKNVDPDQTPQNTASDQGLHWLSHTQQYYTDSEVIKSTCWREVHGKLFQICQIYPEFPMKVKLWIKGGRADWTEASKPHLNPPLWSVPIFIVYISMAQRKLRQSPYFFKLVLFWTPVTFPLICIYI